MEHPDLLSTDSVAICIDTNILIEFRALGDLPWSELAPAASAIRVIVPTKVSAEMDAHKSSGGRLRKRAVDFSRLAARLESNGYAPITLRDSKPLVTLEFGPLFKTKDLDGELFDLDDADNRIVAEVFRMAQDIEDLTFMSDDGLPIRLAHHAGLPVVRPPVSWRRPDGPDERDQQIADLRRQLGPQPELFIEFHDGDGETAFHTLQYPPEAICFHCAARVAGSVLAAYPEIPRHQLEARHPSALIGTGVFNMPFPTRLGEVTAAHLDDYKSDYREFATQVQAWAYGLPVVFSRRGPITIVRLLAGNKGDRAADRVHLEASLTGPFRFLDIDDFRELGDGFIRPPDEPTPFGPLASTASYLPTETRRVDLFYAQDAPGESDGTTMISWRCEEFRQDSTSSIVMLIAADRADAKGAITVRMRGGDLAKGATLTAALRTAPDPSMVPFHRYLRDRLELVPERFSRALRKELDLAARACTCPTGASHNAPD
ncbi:hypothetical protein FNA67_17475 [Youhaiella tibetensis]|uniref:Uncharacterized protein n=1 Tax=Paradevosia tibetensis TaxID=1447062 RepID=A0A5B9DSE9_9HYPH|nr:PIN domain-containing protein [Youhaiella tibetensis]QEE21865.1 hypothetical protein FNA67_17475 [Youhaiella tibetensis]